MATRTISVAGGAWNSAATWVEGEVPTSADDVVATALSGEVKIEAEANCKSADFTGYAAKLNWKNAVAWNVYGTTLKFVAGMTFAPASTRTINFLAPEGSTIDVTMAGKNLGKVVLNSKGSTLAMKDAFECTGTLENKNEGKVDSTAAGTVKVNIYSQTTGCELKMGTAVWTVTAGSSTPFDVSSGSASMAEGTVVYSPASATSRKLNIGNKTLGTFTCTTAGSTGQVTIEHEAGTIKVVNFSDASNARTLLLLTSTLATNTLTVETWNVFGTAGKLMTVEATSTKPAILSKSSGTVEVDYCAFKKIKGTGGATWYVGGHSEDLGENEGLIFSTPGASELKAESAAKVTAEGAELTVEVNPNGKATMVEFEWGTDDEYGTTTAEVSAGEGSGFVKVGKAIAGLDPNKLYHFRAKATNSKGATTGEDAIFCAGGGTPSAETLRDVAATNCLWGKRLLETDSGRSTKLRHIAIGEVHDPFLVFPNPHSAAIMVTASLERSDAPGVYLPLHFAGEDADYEVEVPAESLVFSDPLEGTTFEDALKFYSNTRVRPAEPGGSYFKGQQYIEPGDETGQKVAVSTTDYTKAANPGGGVNYGYGPCAIGGRRADGSTVIVALGDSIAAGKADAHLDTEKYAATEKGYMARSYSALPGLTLQNLAIGGSVGYSFSEADLRNYFCERADVIFWEWLVNDLGDEPLSKIIQGYIDNWDRLAGFGARLYVTACTPFTNSSDSFATTANQTPATGRYGPDPCDKQTYNEWLRDGAPINESTRAMVAAGTEEAGVIRIGEGDHPVSQVVDVASAVEVYDAKPKSEVWKVGLVEPEEAGVKGIHPNQAGHEAIAGLMPGLEEEEPPPSALTIALPLSRRNKIVNPN